MKVAKWRFMLHESSGNTMEVKVSCQKEDKGSTIKFDEILRTDLDLSRLILSSGLRLRHHIVRDVNRPLCKGVKYHI